MPEPAREEPVADDGEEGGKISIAEERFERGRRTVGLFVGPLLFLVLWFLPLPGISTEAHRLAAVLGWILTYWICEPIPIPATALLGPVLCVVLGIAEPQAVFAPFANPVVFLFIGSFILAQGMIAHGLNERIALSILSAGWVRGRGRRLALALGLIPLAISAWISDSAATAMIYPILIGILDALHGTSHTSQGRRFSSGLLLTISYAALIGGVMTPVGTPPNLIGIGMLGRLADRHIGFFQWMTLAVPISLALAACMFAIMTVAFPAVRTDGSEAMELVRRRRTALGPWSRGEKNALFAFVVAVVLWVLPGIVASVLGPKAAMTKLLERHLPEGVASLIAALLLFLLPTDWKSRRFTLRWADATRIHWGTILLFGGGLSLGGLMFSTHLADVLGRALIDWSGVDSVWGLTAIAVALAIGLTEVTSNTATASMLVPLVIALAKALEVSPVPPTIGVCMGASMAFMLPVSTPSNAIVYGSGRVPITAMIRAGIILDIVGYGVILAGLWLLCPLVGLGCAPDPMVTESESAIYRGEEARSGWDSVVRLNRWASQFDASSCSATVVAPRVATTAKHCLEATEPSDLALELGPDGENGAVGIAEFRVTDWNMEPGQDFAVLVAAERIQVYPYSPFARSWQPEEGQPITLVGYGQRDNGFAGRRMVGEAALDGFDGTYLMTSGDPACFGDSGGAAFDETATLVGVIVNVWGIDPNDPCEGLSGHTRVDAWSAMLDQAIQDSAVCEDEVCDDGWDDDCDGLVDEGCLPLGSPCAVADDCASRDCREVNGAVQCTRPCDPAAGAAACPVGLWCVPVSDGGACAAGEAPPEPETEDASAGIPDAGDAGPSDTATYGCGCQMVRSPRSSPSAWFACFAILLAALRGRRARPIPCTLPRA